MADRYVPTVLKSGSLNLLERLGPVQGLLYQQYKAGGAES